MLLAESLRIKPVGEGELLTHKPPFGNVPGIAVLVAVPVLAVPVLTVPVLAVPVLIVLAVFVPCDLTCRHSATVTADILFSPDPCTQAVPIFAQDGLLRIAPKVCFGPADPSVLPPRIITLPPSSSG